jgi:hypothetical protein
MGASGERTGSDLIIPSNRFSLRRLIYEGSIPFSAFKISIRDWMGRGCLFLEIMAFPSGGVREFGGIGRGAA